MKIEKGIALYSIELDGCLNGVYTNEDVDGLISNEILIPLDKGKYDNPLIGEYLCRYFDNKTKLGYEEILEISLEKRTNGTYIFTWKGKNNVIKFTGVGYKMTEKLLAVSYKAGK